MPTPAQRKVLEAMKGGRVAFWNGGKWQVENHVFSRSTIEAMTEAKLLRWIGPKQMVLTPAGRAAISDKES